MVYHVTLSYITLYYITLVSLLLLREGLAGLRHELEVVLERGEGYCRLRCCCLELLDRELLVYFQEKDKLEKLESRNLSSMRGFQPYHPPFRVLLRLRLGLVGLRDGAREVGLHDLVPMKSEPPTPTPARAPDDQFRQAQDKLN